MNFLIIINFVSTYCLFYPQLISEYLIKSNKDWILTEYKQEKNLSEYTRQQLVIGLCAFMHQFFGSQSLNKSQKVMTSTAVLQLFPSMQSQEESDGGIVCFINFCISITILLTNQLDLR